MNNIYPEDANIIDIIASLPGIKNVSSNLSFSSDPDSVHILFNVYKEDKGLFLLTRCIDRRYWKYGHKWKIELSVGDMFKNNILPTTYNLCSYDKINEATMQSKDLIKNINYHLNHEVFLSGYNLNREDFRKSYISYMRHKKLKEINERNKDEY
jgi:hypothetical protein